MSGLFPMGLHVDGEVVLGILRLAGGEVRPAGLGEVRALAAADLALLNFVTAVAAHEVAHALVVAVPVALAPGVGVRVVGLDVALEALSAVVTDAWQFDPPPMRSPGPGRSSRRSG